MAAMLPLGGCKPDVPGPVLGQQVDAHCHVFNILDIPAYGFVLSVVSGSGTIGPAAESLALFIIGMLEGSAPDFADEQRVLNGILAGTIDRTKVPRNSDRSSKLFDNGLRRFVDRHTTAGTPGPTENAGDRQRHDAFLRDTLIRPYVPPDHPLLRDGGRPAQLREAAPQIEALIRAGKLQAKGGGKVSEDAAYLYQILFEWAPVLANYRFQMAADLGALFEGSAPKQQLLAPAIIDIAAWLKDGSWPPTPTTQLEQAELMRLIALVQPADRAVHGLIGFDPYHQIAPPPGTPPALDIVKTAIKEKGLIGVKVYPPMGFQATGNKDLTDDKFPDWLVAGHPQLGVALDAALEELYAWCEAEDVPIMAHCAATQGGTAGYECRADPKFWGQVLQRHPKLRLNLAHFGGIWQFDGHAPTGSCDTADWTTPIAVLMETYPNLYGDVGDFSNVLMRPWDINTAAVMAQLKALVAAHPVVAQRLMYGTDWQLLDREPKNQIYYQSMRDQVAATLGDAFLPGFFRDNGLRFFALGTGEAGHRRLSDFYGRNGKSSWLLQ